MDIEVFGDKKIRKKKGCGNWNQSKTSLVHLARHWCFFGGRCRGGFTFGMIGV